MTRPAELAGRWLEPWRTSSAGLVVGRTGNGAFASTVGCHGVRFHGDAPSESTKRPATVAIGFGIRGR
jgi:hypothetical protein